MHSVVEGYKAEGAPRIELYRGDRGDRASAPASPSTIAIVSDEEAGTSAADVPSFHLDDVAAICDFLRERMLG